MLNLLIIDKNINDSKTLINHILESNYHIRIHYITDNLIDGIKILNTGLVDITLINIDESIDFIISSLYSISDLYFEKYKKSILVISPNINNTSSNYYIYEYVSCLEKTQIILSKINLIVNSKLILYDNSILINKIKGELKYIGYNLSYNGTTYISECIALMYNNPECYENLTKDVYPIIAKKYNKSINNVKCNIISATNAMFYECDENRLKDYFSFYTICRPKPKLVIYTILNKLK